MNKIIASSWIMFCNYISNQEYIDRCIFGFLLMLNAALILSGSITLMANRITEPTTYIFDWAIMLCVFGAALGCGLIHLGMSIFISGAKNLKY